MGPCRILIVEDELLVAADVETSLQRAGHEVVGIADGYAQAVALAERMRPDLVLMDIKLRGKVNGISAAEAIRERWQIPVIFLTANADEQTLEAARTVGPFGFLTKPFRNEELLETIRIAIAQSQQVHALFASHRWLTTVLDSLTDAVVATDAKACVRYLNPAAEVLTGWTPAEAQGRTIEEVHPLRTLQGAPLEECLLQRALRTGEFQGRARFVLTTKAGAEVFIEDSAAPIRENDAIIGAVTIFVDIADRVAGERELEQEKDRLEELALLSAQALGETRAELRALAGNLMSTQEQERRRIARELHDGLGQQAALLEMTLDRAGTEGEIGAAVREALRAQIRQMSTGLREVSHRLHPSILEDLGLSAALQSLVDKEREAGHDVTLTVRDLPAGLSLDVTTALYRIAQEALHNAAKHAPGARVQLSLSATKKGPAKELQMRVADNGPGFSLVEVRRRGGLGLVSMQERARLAGGRLVFSPYAGKGTTVLVRIPLQD